MFRILYSLLLFLIIFFLIWMCIIKLLYRNNQCLYIRRTNFSQIKTNDHLLIDPRLKLNHFTILGTHNSYHKESLFYKSNHRNLENQFTYGIRQIELDIHLMSNNDVVYHLQIFDDQTNCYCLSNCLERIFIWSKRNSFHYPIYLFIEIKQEFYEDLFTSLSGGVHCQHFQMIKEQILQIFSMDALILSEQIRGNQSSINLALKKQREKELNEDFTYENYGWPPLYLSVGKLIPIFIDDVHNIVQNLIPTCEPLSNFFFIAQKDFNVDYASIISISDPLENQHLITEHPNYGQLIRVLLGYNSKQLIENYNQTRKYGVHIISTDYVQCNHTELCRYVFNDFQRTSSILCNTILLRTFVIHLCLFCEYQHKILGHLLDIY